MYKQHFQLAQTPFANTAEPALFCMTPKCRDILAAMLHSIRSRKGLVCISGEIGAGKTTLARALVHRLPAETTLIHLSPLQASAEDMLTFVATELGLEANGGSPFILLQTIRDRLAKLEQQGAYCLLIIDEAQHLSDSLFPPLLQLANLEAGAAKLLQVVLLGQKELLARLNDPLLRPLQQRLHVTCFLSPMEAATTGEYVRFRFQTAGGDPGLFTDEVITALHAAAGGIPRVVNVLCDTLLLNCFLANRRELSAMDVAKAYADLGLALFGQHQPVACLPPISSPDPLTSPPIELGLQHRGHQAAFRTAGLAITALCLTLLATKVFNILPSLREDSVPSSARLETTVSGIHSPPPAITSTSSPAPEKRSALAATEAPHTSTPPAASSSPSPSIGTTPLAEAPEEQQKDTPIPTPVVIPSSQVTGISLPPTTPQLYAVLLMSCRTKFGPDDFPQKSTHPELHPYREQITFPERGTWHGLFLGPYRDRESAETMINQFALAPGYPVRAKFITYSGSFPAEPLATVQVVKMRTLGLKPCLIHDNGLWCLYPGAFLSREMAEEQCRVLTRAGIVCRVLQT